MRIVQLSARDFRAFPGTFDLPLKNGCNLLLHGENGAGKSSLAAALREFLSLERPFPRPVQPFTHVFPNLLAPPDPATGQPPPRAPKVSLKFADPDDELAWEPGKLHPLQLDDGKTPASTTQPQRELLVGVSRQSGFFDYRALLRSSYRQGASDLGPQLFSLFVESLLPGFRPDGGAKTLGDLWERVKQAKPRFRYLRNLRSAKSATEDFNAKLAPFLEQVRVEANRLLGYFPSHRMEILGLACPGCQYSTETKELLGDRINLAVKFGTYEPKQHEDFLNEARLTALGLSLFLAAVKLADSNPADPAPLRVLLLDDVLIGLDLSNRIPLLDLLHKEFANHQIFLFTHDSVWFDIAKAHTEQWGNWSAYSIYADIAGEGEPDVPRLKGDMDDLAVAKRHLDAGDLRAAAVYVRAAFEARLRNICESKGIAIGFKSDPHEVAAGKLWDGIIARHDERKASQGKKFIDEALIPRLSAVRSAVLNRLSHTGPPALTAPDVRAAIATVRDFRASNVPFEP